MRARRDAPSPPRAQERQSLAAARTVAPAHPGGGHDHPPGAPSSSTPRSRHPPLGPSRGSTRVPVGGLREGVGSRWRRRRRNRARRRHHRCQGGCRALKGVGRGVCGPGLGLCSARSLHASLCLVVNMRDEHNNTSNNVSVARQWCMGSDLILFIRARYSQPGGGGARPGLWRLPRPVLRSHLGDGPSVPCNACLYRCEHQDLHAFEEGHLSALSAQILQERQAPRIRGCWPRVECSSLRLVSLSGVLD